MNLFHKTALHAATLALLAYSLMACNQTKRDLDFSKTRTSPAPTQRGSGAQAKRLNTVELKLSSNGQPAVFNEIVQTTDDAAVVAPYHFDPATAGAVRINEVQTTKSECAQTRDLTVQIFFKIGNEFKELKGTETLSIADSNRQEAEIRIQNPGRCRQTEVKFSLVWRNQQEEE